MTRYIYKFAEGSAAMRDELGGKGAGLAEMTNIGLPVPAGFTITTQACRDYYAGTLNRTEFESELAAAIAWLQDAAGLRFGGAPPLLVSVRSGAKFSMPGMMETLLNVGLEGEQGIESLGNAFGSQHFALDAYRRFLQLYGKVVREIPADEFETVLSEAKKQDRVQSDHLLRDDTLRRVGEQYRAIIAAHSGPPPASARGQIDDAIEAVWKSWNGEKARTYREHEGISHDLGTAVNIVQMVFGNADERSGTGVLFTRDPNTGEPQIYGEYLEQAQGEDVVSGARTPHDLAWLEQQMPAVHEQLINTVHLLENHYKDMQDVEFTVERGKLYVLQTRNGKRTPAAAVRIAVDLANRGTIDRETALGRVSTDELVRLLLPQFEPAARRAAKPVLTGLAASPGAASGRVALTAKRAEQMAKDGPVILVRDETSPDDIAGIIAAQGVLTGRGGRSSHAAVVTRGMGKPAVVGAGGLEDLKLNEGVEISIDGASGEVYLGRLPTIPAQLEGNEELRTLLAWADEQAKLGVEANADTPHDAANARSMGARGIGLCRTEHMFFDPERLPWVQQLLASQEGADTFNAALKRVEEFQYEDFVGILRAMDGLPVTVRLLDAPLHEFLSEEMGVRPEQNPMLGHRGCRMGITHPALYVAQTRAIVRAATKLREEGLNPQPRIMLPLIATLSELEFLRARLQPEAGGWPIGIMVETPRAALVADTLVEASDFFSFGTNDLTQMTFGLSRDDAEESFLTAYGELGLIEVSPFVTVDPEGVGRLVEIATEAGRKAKPQFEIGVCGEHGGDPDSIHFFHKANVSYVSCSPYRVPVARLAAAQAALGAAESRTK
ncbi:MAG TPA: pyruvate, phosphate dikinase [Dehalococcoidia bacterium]|nr:pyruvate, phosphate dikinase [Dehalococcoidia bacterium]